MSVEYLWIPQKNVSSLDTGWCRGPVSLLGRHSIFSVILENIFWKFVFFILKIIPRLFENLPELYEFLRFTIFWPAFALCLDFFSYIIPFIAIFSHIIDSFLTNFRHQSGILQKNSAVRSLFWPFNKSLIYLKLPLKKLFFLQEFSFLSFFGLLRAF